MLGPCDAAIRQGVVVSDCLDALNGAEGENRLAHAERGAIRRALLRERGNVTATSRRLGHIPETSADQVDAAVRAARQVQPGWERLPAIERANHLRKVSAKLRQHRVALADIIIREQGRIRTAHVVYIKGQDVAPPAKTRFAGSVDQSAIRAITRLAIRAV